MLWIGRNSVVWILCSRTIRQTSWWQCSTWTIGIPGSDTPSMSFWWGRWRRGSWWGGWRWLMGTLGTAYTSTWGGRTPGMHCCAVRLLWINCPLSKYIVEYFIFQKNEQISLELENLIAMLLINFYWLNTYVHFSSLFSVNAAGEVSLKSASSVNVAEAHIVVLAMDSGIPPRQVSVGPTSC